MANFSIKEKYIPTFKKIVLNISELSTCAYRKVGAIIVKDNRIVTEGFNGAPSGMMECKELDQLIKGEITKETLALKYGNITNYAKIIERALECPNSHNTLKRKEYNPIHNIYEIHAEMNAITQCAKHGININGASIITTHLPCLDCAKAIVASGIKEVYYIEEYKDSKNNYKDSKEFFRLNNVKLIKI